MSEYKEVWEIDWLNTERYIQAIPYDMYLAHMAEELNRKKLHYYGELSQTWTPDEVKDIADDIWGENARPTVSELLYDLRESWGWEVTGQEVYWANGKHIAGREEVQGA